MHQNRRDFLRHASASAAGLAGVVHLPLRWLDPRRSADQLIETAARVVDDAEVRALAMRALEVAKAAGATYADVRINQGRSLGLFLGAGAGLEDKWEASVLPSLATTGTMGVRAVVGGTWGFAGGSTLTVEAAEGVAQAAVGLARGGKRRVAKAWEYAPAPVVPDGRWETPIEVDPFTISIGQYMQIYRAGMDAARLNGPLLNLGGNPGWLKTERLFASTEGSVISQRTHLAFPGVYAQVFRPADRRLYVIVPVEVPGGGYGYETLAKLDLKTEWRKVAEEAVRRASLPFKSAEVGRYPVVFNSDAMAQMLLPTGRALELDRALGDKANEDGTTFAMPPLDILGKYKLGTPLITITGDRSRPHAPGTIGWDEEGVKPEEFTLVQGGTVVDYVTTRAYAPTLAPWYAQQKQPMRSHGCAARTGGLQPILQLPNLTLQPGAGATSLEDLIKDVKRGYYVVSGGASTDQQQMNMQFGVEEAYEIVDGKLGPAVIDIGVQFSLQQFWKNVAALGGARAAKLETINLDLPSLDAVFVAGAQSVPGLVRELNVINIGREA